MGGSRKKHLRLVGQVVPVQPTDTSIVLQGFTYEAPEDFHDVALEQDAARVDDILCGVMALSSEPIAVVDAVTLDVLMTSRAWRVQDFGHAGGLAEIAQGDPAELHKFIAKAADSYIEPVSMPVCLRRTDGSEKTVRMIATGIDSLPEERDVVVRLDL